MVATLICKVCTAKVRINMLVGNIMGTTCPCMAWIVVYFLRQVAHTPSASPRCSNINTSREKGNRKISATTMGMPRWTAGLLVMDRTGIKSNRFRKITRKILDEPQSISTWHSTWAPQSTRSRHLEMTFSTSYQSQSTFTATLVVADRTVLSDSTMHRLKPTVSNNQTCTMFRLKRQRTRRYRQANHD